MIYRMNRSQQIIDEILVMDAQNGSRRAMDMLVQRWQKRIWRHALHLTGDHQAAWDVAQQTWLAIVKGLGKLHDPARFKAWAYRITTNKAIDWIKNSKAPEHINPDRIHDYPQAEKKELGVKELLAKLDMKKKAVLTLYYFQQLSLTEISAALDIPKGTVKSRLDSARREFKQIWLQHSRQ